MDLKRPAPAVDHLIDAVKAELGGEWRIVSSRLKLHKTLFEAEYDGRRVIGKVSESERARTAFRSMQQLWRSGLCPPARYTVAEPIAWLPEHSLLIQEKAPGSCVLDRLKTGDDSHESIRQAGGWLNALWNCGVAAPVEDLDASDVEKRMAALAAALEDRRPITLGRAVVEALEEPPAVRVPSHGDYHPMNIFVSPDRVTAIDLDTFACREKEADVAYFVAQTANLSLQHLGGFQATAELRSEFLRHCGPLDMDRICGYVAWTFLKSLHYDCCILRIPNNAAETYLDAAAGMLEPDATGRIL